MSVMPLSSVVVDTKTAQVAVAMVETQVLVRVDMPSVSIGIPGQQGSQGPPGQTGPPGVVWKGSWDINTNYAVGDAVSYGGVSWVAYVDPPTGDIPPSHPERWQMVADKGQPGAASTVPGPTGPPGADGIIPSSMTLGASQQLTSLTIADDGSVTSAWPNRWEWKFDPQGAAPAVIVSWQNEYGETRHTPAKVNTVAWRAHARNVITDAPHSGYVANIEKARNDSTVLWGVTEAGMYAAGTFTRPNAEGTQTQPVQRVLTQAAYDALVTKDAGTLYYIVG